MRSMNSSQVTAKNGNHIIALDARTGTQLWRYLKKYPEASKMASTRFEAPQQRFQRPARCWSSSFAKPERT